MPGRLMLMTNDPHSQPLPGQPPPRSLTPLAALGQNPADFFGKLALTHTPDPL